MGHDRDKEDGMTDSERVVDEMCDVYALLTARINDDQASFENILFGEQGDDSDEQGAKTMQLIIAVTDLAVSTLRVAAAERGISVSTLIRSMAMVTRVVGPEIIKERERGY